MAVYTTLTELEVNNLLSSFGLARLQSFQGAGSGVENTTYFLTLTTGSQYVLTVFESLSANELLPYIQLLTLLHNHDLPVPSPSIDKSGLALQVIADKPALVFPRSSGKHIDVSSPSLCYAVGATLAQIHTVTSGLAPLSSILSNPSGSTWMSHTHQLVSNSLSQVDNKLLQDQIDLSLELESRYLPCGIIHGDLFRDNVLVDNNAITAVIDFYNASRDILLLDLAIAANDWCYIGRTANDSRENVRFLLDGYQLHRTLTEAEYNSWQDCLQVAATRLWLSRLKRLISSQHADILTIKNPDEYKTLLLHHLQNPKSHI